MVKERGDARYWSLYVENKKTNWELKIKMVKERGDARYWSLYVENNLKMENENLKIENENELLRLLDLHAQILA